MDEPSDFLATRVPRDVRRAVRLHCLEAGITMEAFIAAAVAEKLRRQGHVKGRRRTSRMKGR